MSSTRTGTAEGRETELRWDVENQGFNEAVNEWNLDHTYHHDLVCFEVLWLLGYLAMNLVRSFYRRRIQPRSRDLTLRHVARELASALYAGTDARHRSAPGPG